MAAVLAATLAAPPNATRVSRMVTTGTGASREARPQPPGGGHRPDEELRGRRVGCAGGEGRVDPTFPLPQHSQVRRQQPSPPDRDGELETGGVVVDELGADADAPVGKVL